VTDLERGIYRKYEVRRLNDPTGKHAECEYYVLDWKHDKFTIPAVLAYAAACEAEFPELARDLRARAALASPAQAAARFVCSKCGSAGDCAPTCDGAMAPAQAAAPCPGCVCADTEHRYCPICADRIAELKKALLESRRHIVAGRRFAGLPEDGPEVRSIDAALRAKAPK